MVIFGYEQRICRAASRPVRPGLTARARILLVALSLLAWLPGVYAETIRFGELVIHSMPGQPLRASIPISLPDGLPLTALQVRLADATHYQQQGLDYPALLDEVHIALLARGEQQAARIQLLGNAHWQGEAIELLLQIESPGQRHLKRFPIMGIHNAEQTTFVTVGPHETLDRVAIRLADYHNRSYLHMMVALYRANPQAFYRDNMNNLRGGVALRLPSHEELYRLDDAEVFATIREHQARWRSAATDANAVPAPQATAAQDASYQELLEQLQSLGEAGDHSALQHQTMREQLQALESRVSRLGNDLLGSLNTAQPQAQPTAMPASETTQPPAWPFLTLLTLVLGIGLAMPTLLRLYQRYTTGMANTAWPVQRLFRVRR